MVCYFIFLSFLAKTTNILFFFSFYTGQICGYELSLHKHDDALDNPSGNLPFLVQLINNEATLKFKSDSNHLDCEVKQTYRFFIRAYDCAPSGKRRYSERYVGKKNIKFFFSCCCFFD